MLARSQGERRSAILSRAATLKFVAGAAVIALIGGVLATARVLESDPATVPGAPLETELVATSQWETRGDPDNPLLFGNSIEVAPDGIIWVLDARGGFQIIAPEGSFVESWGSPGRGEGELGFDREIDSLY